MGVLSTVEMDGALLETLLLLFFCLLLRLPPRLGFCLLGSTLLSQRKAPCRSEA